MNVPPEPAILARKHADFRQLALDTIARDDARSAALKGLQVKEKFEKVFQILTEDKAYANEYRIFVKGMSYRKGGEVLSFEQAMKKLHEVMQHVTRT